MLTVYAPWDNDSARRGITQPGYPPGFCQHDLKGVGIAKRDVQEGTNLRGQLAGLAVSAVSYAAALS